ncbi:MAG: LPXTG cell wall anchor domain-containing protein [Erysipelotrichaceae bacterium]|nr:LPXTG cell wall anchor domain-containing protein [Erysipelotrichaceae bacterium]
MDIQRAIRNYLENHAERKRWLKIVFSLGLVVSLITTALMTLPATAKAGVLICEKEEHTHGDECYTKVLAAIECEYAERETHLHDDSCYIDEMVLVCDEDHEHTEECYETVRTLTCDKEEFVLLHTHDENCYDSEGNLICPLEERKEHEHSDECYTTDEEGEKVLICEEREVKEHPEHTDECYETDEEGNRVLICDLPVAVTHQHTEECIVPEHKVFTCEKEEHIHTDECYDYTKEAIDAADEEKEVATVEDDNTVTFEETAGDVKVTVKADTDAFPEGTTMTVTPVDSEEVMDTVTDTLGDKQIVTVKAVDITFWSNGEEVEPAKPITVSMSSAPEGRANESAVIHIDNEGTADIVAEADNVEEELTFDTDSFSVYVMTYTVDFEYEVDGKVYTFSMTGGDAVSFKALVETLHLLDGTDKNASEFINDIKDIQFSDPELVSVVKITNNSSLGAIKQQYDLECEYPEELMKFEIDKMNAKLFYSPDWALVSLKPFSTPESITVTMKKGEVFKIDVTDAQLETKVITADGTGFVITVTYDEDAGIPDGAELFAKEIRKDSDEYKNYLKDSAEELGYGSTDEIDSARFFDIEIKKDGEKIEPLKPVTVEIAYTDAMNLELGKDLKVIHFAEEGTEVIEDVDLANDNKEVSWKQDSFSVTGTIISGSPGTNRDRYMILVQYPENSDNYYVLNNDGSLSPVTLNSDGTVSVEYAMLWTFGGSTGWPNRRIWMNSEGTGYTNQMISSDYYRRFIDPGTDSGLTEETTAQRERPVSQVVDGLPGDDHPVSDNVNKYTVNLQNRPDGAGVWHSWNDGRNYWDSSIDGRAVDSNLGNPSRDDVGAWNSVGLGLNGDGNIFRGDSYLGLEFDSKGNPVRVVGNKSSADAAKFVFAEASNIGAHSVKHNSVGHIDISIDGSSKLNLPLARGTYYYKDENDQWVELVIDYDITLPLDAGDVRIQPDDMKHAAIKAYDKNGNELNDVFAITGFSANSTAPNDTPQVRIEGEFKVANIPDISENWWVDGNSSEVCASRLDNPITYEIQATKSIPFKFIDTQHGWGQLYEKQKDGTYKELEVTVDIALSASFNYFDSDNTCPGIRQFGDVGLWERGGIQGHNQSGMDFRLGGDADGQTNVVAVEITKMIMDENRSMIHPEDIIWQSFTVYESREGDGNHGSGGVDECTNVTANQAGANVPSYTTPYTHYDLYTELHDKELSVNSSGIGVVFDYDVKPGMFYITENTEDIQDLITDTDGETWKYVETRIETEYVWRNDGMSGRHQSDVYTGKTGNYASIPDVLGTYTGMLETGNPYMDNPDYTSSTWIERDSSGNITDQGSYRNGFLEFYVYNIYTKYTKLDVEKVWNPATAEPDDAEVTVELRYSKRQIGDASGEWSTPGPWTPADYENYLPIESTDPIFADSTFDTVLTLKADTDPNKNWKGSFENLPKRYKDTSGNVYELDYYAVETAVKVGTDDITDKYEISITKEDAAADQEFNDGKVTITNKPRPDLEIVKVEQGTNNRLTGAVFELQYRAASTDDYAPANSVEGINIKELNDSSQFVVPEAGITLTGLPNGQYRLREVSAPEGHVILAEFPVYFTVENSVINNQTGTIEDVEFVAATTTAIAKFTIPNPPGAPLPNTGGIGTYPYQILGGLLIMLGAILLRIRRKKGGGEYA